MSYLKLDGGITDFTKAVISIWFRVPQDSIDSARAADAAFNLPRMIPLMTFGPTPMWNDMEPVGGNIGVAVNFAQADCPFVPSIVGYSSAGTYKLDPCYVGVNCGADPATLCINIQMAGLAAISGFANSVTHMDVWSLLETPPPFPPGQPDISPGSGYTSLGFPFIGKASAMIDFSSDLNTRAEYFFINTTQVVTPDHWHHLLLSVDLSNGCSTFGSSSEDRLDNTAAGTTRFSKMWYSLDDINYNGEDNLGPYFVDGGTDPNAILTNNAWHVAQARDNQPYNLFEPTASLDFPAAAIGAGKPVGLPASADWVDNIYAIELAELQFFTGVTLDTSVVANRRAFISASSTPDPDAPDAPLTGGTPVDPNKKASDTDSQSGSIELLGKNPDVLLHGSDNWVEGKNTGPMIDNPDYDPDQPTSADNPLQIPDPAKQFIPTGKIVSYTPDPSLHGQQSPTPPPAVRLQRRIRVPA